MAKLSHAKRALVAALAGAFLAAALPPAQALEPAAAIDTRKAVMASIGAHVNGIRAGLGAKNAALVAGHARALAVLAPVLPHLFPPGSGPEAGDTRAKAEIWTRWDEFVGTTAALRAQATELAELAEFGETDRLGAQFGKMARAGCGACHRAFRVPE